MENNKPKRFKSMNAFIVEDKNKKKLISYKTTVCIVEKSIEGRVTLTQWWDYSISTLKQITEFLKEHNEYFYNQFYPTNKKRLVYLIDNGYIKLINVRFNDQEHNI